MDYLSKYEDMCMIQFAICDEVIQPLLEILCEHMDFVLISNKAKQKNPIRTPFQFGNYNGFYKTNETFYYCNNKNDSRSFLLISEGVSDWFNVSIKIRKCQMTELYNLIHGILQYIQDYAGPPCPASSDDLICRDINYVERDLKTCGLI